jgi:hypothetical protein
VWVLVVGVLLLLASGFLVSVAVRVQTQLDHEQPRPGPAVAQSLMSAFDAVESR